MRWARSGEAALFELDGPLLAEASEPPILSIETDEVGLARDRRVAIRPRAGDVDPRLADRVGRALDEVLDPAEVRQGRLFRLDDRAIGEPIEEVGLDGEPLEDNLLEQLLVVAARLVAVDVRQVAQAQENGAASSARSIAK
jgi:hypothetical protein